jgi:hypothetical protein
MIGVIPKTWQDALAGWDAGEPVFTIELGGLGPSYEQSMHIAIFETLRMIGDMDTALHRDTQCDVIDKAIRSIDRDEDLGLKAAQAAMIRRFVYTVMNHGWHDMIVKYDTDRHIQVCRAWPGKKK